VVSSVLSVKPNEFGLLTRSQGVTPAATRPDRAHVSMMDALLL
jgi:hypothetical protein